MQKDLTTIIKRIEKLEKAVFGKRDTEKQKQEKANMSANRANFSLNERAFMKRHAKGKSGPKKFTIFVAYLSHGIVQENIQLSEVEKRWNKMKSLLGSFNRYYCNEAKNNGWLDSKKRGYYNLTEEWKNVL